jgi:hypothetical protein
MARTREELRQRIRDEQQFWRSLVAAVGRDRMDEPGPMGDWTFKDLASHLAGWRNRNIARLEAAGRGTPEPRPPWPAELEDDDDINPWIRERDLARPLDDVLGDYDRSFDRLSAAIDALPDEAVTTRGYFGWMGDESVLETDWFSHLHDEHEPSIREWLART